MRILFESSIKYLFILHQDTVHNYDSAQDGNSLRPNTKLPQVGNVAVITAKVIIVGPMPAMIKSVVFIFPAAHAIAFGGVPTGR